MTNLIVILISTLMTLSFIGCQNVSNRTTTIEIIDNDRHYYPVLRGQELDVVFTVKNTGKQPFILDDLIITCGCIAPGKSSIRSIPAGKEGKLILKYDSNKNIGYVKHHIDLFGNLGDVEKISVSFDVNVVTDNDSTRDYEEIYKELREKGLNTESMTDGEENRKGYYMDGDF